MNRFGIVLAAVAAFATAGEAAARDQIRIVGSSTVYPFSTAVAEQFGKSTGMKTPVVESTGSGGGMKLFCAGVGVEHPDVTNASRRMKASEFKTCQENGVTAVTEIVAGFDGIVIANANEAPTFTITRAQLWEALVAGSTAKSWNDVDPSLPNEPIEVLGPPPSSGTRDAFEELVMLEGCLEAGKDKSFCKKDGSHLREDGPYIEAGENDNLMVKKLAENPKAVAIFGFSFLDQNSDQIKGATVDGVEPTFENIASGEYPISRSLYYYVKQAHLDVVPGIREYVAEFASANASGADGYLVDKGLIPLPAAQHNAMEERASLMVPMTGADLK